MVSRIPYIKDMYSRIKDAWLGADTRALALFRIAFGAVVFCDIARRIPYINVFYSKLGLIDLAVAPSKYSVKSFSLLSSFTGPTEVTVFFYIALISALLFIVGYRTKLFHFITLVTVLSIHNRVTDIANGGDTVLINFLIWTLFLPLGASLSLDAVRRRLSQPDPGSPEGLNEQKDIKDGKTIFDIAYFACLLQLAVIYLFNFLNKDGQRWFFHDHDPTNNWADGSAVYFMYQLDGFLTPLGNFIQDNIISIPISGFLGASVMLLEASAPILILLPFFMRFSRRALLAGLILFHISIGLSVSIGLFAWVMIAIFPLLLRRADIEMLKSFLRRITRGPVTVFYDTNCGFCHQTARALGCLDSLSNLTWAGESSDIQKPPSYDSLKDDTIIAYDPATGAIWERHRAFGRILLSVPFGFLVAWLFFVPGLEALFGKLYDAVAGNRKIVSSFLGLRACGIGSSSSATMPPEESRSLLRGLACRARAIGSGFVVLLLMYVGALGVLSSNPFNDDLLQDRIYVDVKGYLVDGFGLIPSEIDRKTRLDDILSPSQKSGLFSYMSERYGKKKKSLLNVVNIDRLTERLNDNFRHTKFTRTISRYLRMGQAWNMFSPDVREYDTWLLIEAELDDGSKIDLFTGKESGLYIQGKKRSDQAISLDYELEYGPRKQFWRKYFHRLNKGETKNINRLLDWIDQGSVLKGTGEKIHDFFRIPEGRSIRNVRLYKLSDYNARPDSDSKRRNGVVEFKRGDAGTSDGPMSRKGQMKKRK